MKDSVDIKSSTWLYLYLESREENLKANIAFYNGLRIDETALEVDV